MHRGARVNRGSARRIKSFSGWFSRKEAKKDRKKHHSVWLIDFGENIVIYRFPSMHLFNLCGFFRLFAAENLQIIPVRSPCRGLSAAPTTIL
jgi:hypothetical protein